jgi:two-component system chemotaxis response regulator CheY
MKTLIVEDDFTSRLLLQASLSPYGECHIAVNGKEAVEAFQAARQQGQRYDLICMDIMMPEMDGQEALRQIRKLEDDADVLSSDAAKVIMTTALDDIGNVMTAFKGLCDAYLMKPIDQAKLLAKLKSLRLIRNA